MRGISKSFPGVKALQNVDLELHKGEVLALLGENGAGKSTLIKILSGDYLADQGEIIIEGKAVAKNDPHTAISLGVGVIYQELNNADPLSIAENIYMGNLPLNRARQIDYRRLARDTRAMLDRVGLFGEDPFAPLGSLSIAKKQMVEIAKAMSHNVKILVMDEPTASLNDEEIGILFGLVRKMSEAGIAIIYISHRLDEVFEISDNIVVMRDGRRVAKLTTSETNKNELIAHMVGREITDMYPRRTGEHIGKTLLEVTNLSSAYIKNVSFDVHAGEIVGLFGLMGSGRTEVVEMIVGDRRKRSGTIKFDGRPVDIKSPQDAKRLGIGYLPSDRKASGLFLIHSVGDNITLNVLDRILSRLRLISAPKSRRLGMKWMERLRVKAPGVDTLAQALSGGNQQKVVIAKWLAAEPRLLILNDPTRGIDVGAKTEIYNLMNELSRQGLAIIMVSSELPEIMAMSDRIFVLHEGLYKGMVSREEFTQETLLETAIGG
ncbi:MAG: sugar ABC transporter ATP-binding protein [Christensenellaceae bacterium]|nr:sugar ABC transporter ATP-binding protein [Christensenellaceae bacterium]MEA5064977.1 sugar ABC transporter ATP-binding protein [Eubacteriales bacterium]MEA5067370.1 sugar ABC transporter ATP-binding protein [Christensenellaceae bacterium]